MSELIIAPKTKIAELLEAYPNLEPVLIGVVPTFEKLKNPILRRTVARVTTLQQAASVGGVQVEELINRLRQEVGQDLLSGAAAGSYVTARPAWFSEERVVAELDARGMLAAGEHPVHEVIAGLQRLGPGEIYELVAPFMPAPLVDKATSLGMAHWVQQAPGGDGEVTVYFCRQ